MSIITANWLTTDDEPRWIKFLAETPVPIVGLNPVAQLREQVLLVARRDGNYQEGSLTLEFDDETFGSFGSLVGAKLVRTRTVGETS